MWECPHWPIPTSRTNTPGISLHLFTSLRNSCWFEACNTEFCPSDCETSGWSQWTDCEPYCNLSCNLEVSASAFDLEPAWIYTRSDVTVVIWNWTMFLYFSECVCTFGSWMLTKGNGTQNRSRVIQKPAAYGGAGCGALWLELHRTRTFKLRGFQSENFDCLDGLICRIYRSLWFMMIYDFSLGKKTTGQEFSGCVFSTLCLLHMHSESVVRTIFFAWKKTWFREVCSNLPSGFPCNEQGLSFQAFYFFLPAKRRQQKPKQGTIAGDVCDLLWIYVLRSLEVRNAHLRQLLHLGIAFEVHWELRALLLCSTMPYS